MKTIARLTIGGMLAAIVLTAGNPLGFSADAWAQSYPSRDITFIVPYNPGGGTDPVARQFTSGIVLDLSRY